MWASMSSPSEHHATWYTVHVSCMPKANWFSQRTSLASKHKYFEHSSVVSVWKSWHSPFQTDCTRFCRILPPPGWDPSQRRWGMGSRWGGGVRHLGPSNTIKVQLSQRIPNLPPLCPPLDSRALHPSPPRLVHISTTPPQCQSVLLLHSQPALHILVPPKHLIQLFC